MQAGGAYFGDAGAAATKVVYDRDDGLSGDANPNVGQITTLGSVGSFTFNVVAGTSNQSYGLPSDAAFLELTSLTVKNTGSSQATLFIGFSDKDIDFPTPADLNKVGLVSEVTNLPAGFAAFGFQSFVDTNNSLFGLSGPGVTSTPAQTSVGVVSTPFSRSPDSPYSMSNVAKITLNPGDSLSVFGAKTSAVAPELSTLGAWGFVLVLFVFAHRFFGSNGQMA
jgi:hypothetical protein